MRVRNVLERLRAAGMTLNAKKCRFGKQSVKFLGHMISVDGVRPDPDRIEDIMRLPDPTNITELQSLLGTINQLGKFSPRITELTLPLRALLKKTPWIWDVPQSQAVADIKQELSKAPCLAWYSSDKPTIIMCDASNKGLGAAMFQVQSDGSRRLVASKSRSLTETEQRWSPIEKEALGIAWSCSKFDRYILGHPDVTIETDHKPLVPIFNSKAVNDLSIRIQRQRLRAMKYSFTTRHIQGKTNYVADLLSRQPLGRPSVEDRKLAEEIEVYAVASLSLLPATDRRLAEIKSGQADDSSCSKVIEYIQHGWPSYLSSLDTNIKPYWNAQSDLTLINDILMYKDRLVIPLTLRADILSRLHCGHQGVTKCRERARQSVWWPGLSSEIADMVKSCKTCITFQDKQSEPLRPSMFPDRPWQRIASDLFHWQNKEYILVIDYYSRYIELMKLDQTDSEAVINALKSIFARHGIPESVMSDNGPQYASQQFKNFAEEYNFTSITSSPRYPQANGEAERAVRTIKSLLNKSPDPYRALLAYRNTPIQNGYSPAELLMARRLRSDIPVDPNTLVPRLPDTESIQSSEEAYKARMKRNFDNRHNASELPQLYEGDNAYIRDLNRTGIVTENLPGRSHLISTPLGTVRRNRQALSALPTDVVKDPVINSPALRTTPDSPANNSHGNIDTGNRSPSIRRSTRVRKPVQRMNL